MAHQVPVIVITGGSCAGKTSILAHLKAHFERLGYQVIIVEEAATALIGEGRGPAVVGMEEFQRLVLAKTVAQEEAAKAEACRYDNPIIFVDRGVMDGAAYVEPGAMQRIWKEFGHNLIQLRDERYAGVLHLVSVAIGLPHLFSNATNAARYETLEEAIALDSRTLAAWVGTPHLAYIDNGTDFTGKVARAISWAEYFVSGEEHEHKYRLTMQFDPDLLPSHAQCIDIRQSYVRLPSTPKNHRVRARGQNGIFAYTRTMKQNFGPMSCSEDELSISEQEYATLRHLHGIPSHAEVMKQRWCFVENGLYWELDTFRDLPDLLLLEVEVPRPDWPVKLPSWIVGRALEVTGDKAYLNKAIAEEIGRQRSAA